MGAEAAAAAHLESWVAGETQGGSVATFLRLEAEKQQLSHTTEEEAWERPKWIKMG